MLQHRERMRRELTKDLLLARMPTGRGRNGPNGSRSSDSVPETPERPRTHQGGQSAQAQADTAEIPAQPRGAAGTPVRSPEEEESSSVTGEDPMPTIDEAQIDVSECAARILAGLRADAFQIARDIGLERLKSFRSMFFRYKARASELFRVDQQQGGPLSRQNDETMISYVHWPQDGGLH